MHSEAHFKVATIIVRSRRRRSEVEIHLHTTRVKPRQPRGSQRQNDATFSNDTSGNTKSLRIEDDSH